jgi:hypothetical protein
MITSSAPLLHCKERKNVRGFQLGVGLWSAVVGALRTGSRYRCYRYHTLLASEFDHTKPHHTSKLNMIGTKKLISRSRSLTWMITRTASHDSCGHTSRKCGSPFITRGYQPTTRELLDDCNYNMRKRTDASVDEARVLPILDASVIL